MEMFKRHRFELLTKVSNKREMDQENTVYITKEFIFDKRGSSWAPCRETDVTEDHIKRS